MLESLAQTTIQSSILFLAIWLVFRSIKSFPPNSKAWIWRLAFLKPIIGLAPFAAVTLHVLTPPTQVQIVDGISIATTRTVNEASGIETLNSVVNPIPLSSKPSIDPLLSIWIVGASSIAIWAFMSRIRAAKIVRNASPVSNRDIRYVVDQLLVKANIHVVITLLQSDEVQSAMLFGGRRNIVVLPSACNNSDEIRMMLAHEIAHIARRDLAWQTITWIVRCLFFFNPVVWLAVRSSQLDHESATDRYACELAGVPVKTYAEMLLRATVVTRNSLVPGALSVGESYRTIHRRLEAMNHFNTKPNSVRKTAIGLVALATIGLIPMYQFAQAQTDQTKVIKPKVSSVKKKSKRVPATTAKPVAGYDLMPSSASAPVGSTPASASEINPPASSVQSARVSVPGQVMSPQEPAKAQRIAVMPGNRLVVQDTAISKVDQATKTKQKAGKLMPVKDVAILPNQALPSQMFPVADRAAMPMQITDTALPPRSSDPFLAPPAASVANGPTSFGPQLEATSQNEGRSVSFRFENVDIRQAIIALFKTTNRSYLLGDGVKGTINVSGQNVPFEKALAEIIRAAKIESYAEDGVIHFIAP